jgi:hypothetical protein
VYWMNPATLVCVRQVSTFNLDDLFYEHRTSESDMRKTMLSGVLNDALKMVVELIQRLSTIDREVGILKCNVCPCDIVFVPRLLEETPCTWYVDGIGHRDMSNTFVDGLPMLINFAPAWTTSVTADCYCEDAAMVLHCTLMLAHTQARHGNISTRVFLDHLGSNDIFTASYSRIKSQATNVTQFLSTLAKCCNPRQSKFTTELVSDMDYMIKHDIFNDTSTDRHKHFYNKIVRDINCSSVADTRILLPLATSTT